jgi:hypothetical protein
MAAREDDGLASKHTLNFSASNLHSNFVMREAEDFGRLLLMML